MKSIPLPIILFIMANLIESKVIFNIFIGNSQHKKENFNKRTLDVEELVETKRTENSTEVSSEIKLKEFLLDAYKKHFNEFGSFSLETSIFKKSDFDKSKRKNNCTEYRNQQPNSDSVCPHHLISIQRNDRYPYVIEHARCNCFDCLNNEKATCLPNYQIRPVLIKNDNKWIQSIEYVPVFCTCVKNIYCD